MLFVTLYIIIVGLSTTSFIEYFFVFDETISQELADYITNEGTGCTVSSSTEHLALSLKLVLISVVLFISLPFLIVILSIEFRDICYCCKRKNSLKGSTDSQIST